MYAIRFYAAVVALLALPAIANAQFDGPPYYPLTLPEGPPSGLGEYRRQQMERRFWEAWDANYRLEEEQANSEFRALRIADLEARQFARQERIRQAREKNLGRRAQREAQIALRANEFLDEICTGIADWPAALQRPEFAAAVGAVEQILTKGHDRGLCRLQAVDRQALAGVARELRWSLTLAPECREIPHDQRVRALQTVKQLEYLAALDVRGFAALAQR